MTTCDVCEVSISPEQEYIMRVEDDCEYYDISGEWLTCCDFEILCVQCGEEK